jgi:hypothetical protein
MTSQVVRIEMSERYDPGSRKARANAGLPKCADDWLSA